MHFAIAVLNWVFTSVIQSLQFTNDYKFSIGNWLTLTSEMHFVKFHPEVASCLLSRGKRKYAPLGIEAIMKIHKKLFSGIPFNFTLFVISPKLQRIWSWNFGFAIRKIGFSFGIKKNVLLPVEPWGMRMWSA